MKTILFLIIISIILIIALISLNPLSAAAKVLLLVSQEFPQIPFKPLHGITPKPKLEKVKFGPSADGQKIVGDLFIPKGASDAAKGANKNPALIVAMGVKTSDKDRPTLLGFCESLARLGYIVLWPRLETLEKDIVEFEEPQTFIDAFKFLEERTDVDKNRISFVGLSVGSSLSLVAAEDEKINQKVRSIVFFGGYYNIIDYLSSLSTKKIILDGKTVKWETAKGAIDQAQEILEKEGLTLKQFDEKDTFDADLTESLLRFSPHENLRNLKAKIFILHEKSDTFVPYTESIKLKNALEEKGSPIVYHQANLFEHVQPKKVVSYEMAKEFLALFGFLHNVFINL